MCRYSLGQFAQEPRLPRILSASLLTIAAVVSTDLANGLLPLAISWSATSLAVLYLIRASLPGRTTLYSKAQKAFLTSDIALLLGPGSVYVLSAHPSTHLPFTDHLPSSSAIILLVCATVAAIIRAGLGRGRSWVTATISAPTSVSALLHAGVVNAGALLLLRLETITGAPKLYALTIVAACAVTMFLLVPRIRSRIDLKGQLATSTVSQMAFMFAAIALGWPILAVTHLIGHGIYKSARFMGAGSAISSRSTLRRRAPRGSSLSVLSRLAGVGVIALASVPLALLLPSDVSAALLVVAPAAVVVWWSRTKEPTVAPLTLCVLFTVTLVIYALIISGASLLLAPSMPTSVFHAPWWTLGALLAAVVVTTRAHAHKPSTPVLNKTPRSPTKG